MKRLLTFALLGLFLALHEVPAQDGATDEHHLAC
jgi:hypothetical protein